MQAKYKVGDKVLFNMKDCRPQPYIGKIEVVDANGTIEQNEEPSYDIFIREFSAFDGASCLVKHVRESEILGLHK